VEVEEKSREEENWINKIEERDKERQREERWERIKDSKYNKKMIQGNKRTGNTGIFEEEMRGRIDGG